MLTAKVQAHRETWMRTTVNLDPDVEQLLRHATHGSRLNFKEALNDGLRRGLAHFAPAVVGAMRVVKARPMSLQARLVPSRLHDVDDDLDTEAFYQGDAAASRATQEMIAADAQIAVLDLEYDTTVHSADTDFAGFRGLDWKNPLLA